MGWRAGQAAPREWRGAGEEEGGGSGVKGAVGEGTARSRVGGAGRTRGGEEGEEPPSPAPPLPPRVRTLAPRAPVGLRGAGAAAHGSRWASPATCSDRALGLRIPGQEVVLDEPAAGFPDPAAAFARKRKAPSFSLLGLPEFRAHRSARVELRKSRCTEGLKHPKC